MTERRADALQDNEQDEAQCRFGCAQGNTPTPCSKHTSAEQPSPHLQGGQETNTPKRPSYLSEKKCQSLAIARLHSGSNPLHRDISYWLRMGIKGHLLFPKRQGGFFPAPRHIFSSCPGFHLPNTAALYLYLYLFCPPHRG